MLLFLLLIVFPELKGPVTLRQEENEKYSHQYTYLLGGMVIYFNFDKFSPRGLESRSSQRAVVATHSKEINCGHGRHTFLWQCVASATMGLEFVESLIICDNNYIND